MIDESTSTACLRDWYFIAEQPAPAPHRAHLEGCATLRIVLVAVPRISRSCEHFPDGFDLYLLLMASTQPKSLGDVLTVDGPGFRVQGLGFRV